MRPVARMEGSLPLLTVAISVALAFAWAAEFAGLAGIIGSYLAGLMLSLTELREKIMHEVEHIAYAFFVPFFFANVGLSTMFAGMTGPFLFFVLLVVLVAAVTKIAGCGVGALLARFPVRERHRGGGGHDGPRRGRTDHRHHLHPHQGPPAGGALHSDGLRQPGHDPAHPAAPEGGLPGRPAVGG